MKANELRLGNYVKRITLAPESDDKEDDVLVVNSSTIKILENNEVNGNYGGMLSNNQGYSVYIQPIPLTEEWLAKFGFDDKYTSNSIYFRKKSKKKVIRLDVKNGSKKYYDFVEIKYVHQLQNLYFALTGEELMLNS